MKQDLSSPIYATLARFAAQIAKLLNAPSVQADPNLAGTLDDFLGAVYALFFAKRGDFTDRTARSIDVTAVQKRAAQMASGELRPDGKWMAGFHFNSALFRIVGHLGKVRVQGIRISTSLLSHHLRSGVGWHITPSAMVIIGTQDSLASVAG